MSAHAPDIKATETAVKRSYLPQVLLATAVVAVLPAAVVWSVRSAGLVTSYLLVAVIGVTLSLLGSYLGRLFWQRRPGSRNLLFSELMVWGYAHRRYTERRLNSARSVLGALSGAQSSMVDGLSAERQAKLLEEFARALDGRDPRTYGHSRRVARYSWMMATRMGLTREEVARIRTAAAIHDIGKIQTPDSVLNKQGALTDEEYETMKLHAPDGARMSVALHDPELTSIVRHHHERLDGTGYPDRLAGEEIPVGSRIIAVADTFDALTANRVYRRAKTHAQALEILHKEAGAQLDPAAVRAFSAHYAGRRGTTVWGWVTSLPERAFEQLSSAAAGVGVTAKTLAVAALAGSLATSTATLAHPAPRKLESQAPAAALVRSVSGVRGGVSAAGGTGNVSGARGPAGKPIGGPALGAGRQTPGVPPGAGLTGTGSAQQPGATTTASQSPPSPGSEPDPAEGPAPGRSRPVTPPSGSGTTSAPTPAPLEGGSHGGPRAPAGAVEQVTGKLGGTVEAVKGKVEETKAKVEEVAKGKIEETKVKVEETKAKVEEVAKGKLEETKTKVEETAGKLKKITGLTLTGGSSGPAGAAAGGDWDD